MWWRRVVVSARRRWRWKDHEFKASLMSMVRLRFGEPRMDAMSTDRSSVQHIPALILSLSLRTG